MELSQCRFSPFQWVSTSLLQPRDGGCLRSELTQTGRVAEVGWGDRLPGGAFWHPVQTPDGHSKDQMARLILDSVRLREPEQKKRETQKLQERDLLHREAQVRKDHDGGSRTGVGEEKTVRPNGFGGCWAHQCQQTLALQLTVDGALGTGRWPLHVKTSQPSVIFPSWAFETI